MMDNIHYFIILLTLPGSFFHILLRWLLCIIFQLSVYDYKMVGCYPILYHEKPSNWIKALFLSAFPYILSSLLGMLLMIPIYNLLVFSISIHVMDNIFLSIFSAWIGYSIALHAIPSLEEITQLKKIVEKAGLNKGFYWLAAFYILVFETMREKKRDEYASIVPLVYPLLPIMILFYIF